jgi:hypothetical protein
VADHDEPVVRQFSVIEPVPMELQALAAQAISEWSRNGFELEEMVLVLNRCIQDKSLIEMRRRLFPGSGRVVGNSSLTEQSPDCPSYAPRSAASGNGASSRGA